MEEQKLKSKFPGAPGDSSVNNWSLLEQPGHYGRGLVWCSKFVATESNV